MQERTGKACEAEHQNKRKEQASQSINLLSEIGWVVLWVGYGRSTANPNKQSHSPSINLSFLYNQVNNESKERREIGAGQQPLTHYSVIKEMNHSFLYEGGSPTQLSSPFDSLKRKVNFLFHFIKSKKLADLVWWN